MKNKFIINLLLLPLLTLGYIKKRTNNKESFSTKEIEGVQVTKVKPIFFKSSDGVKLAYYPFVTSNKPKAMLIFIHGGGAYSGAGYQYFAGKLSKKYNIKVYLYDIRGHGNSEGRRGDTPTTIQVWKDLKLFIDFLKQKNPEIPFFLGGHSSGCGLILNYLSWNQKSEADGYIFISPQLGYKSNTTKKNIKHPFTKTRIWVFILNGITGGKMFGNTKAVILNYSKETIKKEPLLITYLTCNMALATTPNNPKQQFTELNKPFGLFIGENDELFNIEAIMDYANLPPEKIKKKSSNKILKGLNHLSILISCDKAVNDAISKILK